MTEQDQWTAIANRFWGALDQGDVAEAMACCLPSVTTWHNFDRKFLNISESEAANLAYVNGSVERTTTQVRRDFFLDGFAQQHTLVVRMQAGGRRRAWPVCVLMRFLDGKIASLTEYIDRAGSFDPDLTAETAS